MEQNVPKVELKPATHNHTVVTQLNNKKTITTIALISSLTIIMLNLAAFLPIGATEVARDTWLTKTDMPTARAATGAAVVDGKIYVIGGFDWDFNLLGTNEMYDPSNNSWTTKASMPTPRAAFGIVAYENKIYCIGGQIYNTTTHTPIYLDTVEVYNPATDTWENKTVMPTARARLQTNIANGKIYVMGGETNQSLNYAYDPALDGWTIKAPIPQVITDGANKTGIYAASGTVDNKIYWMGTTTYNGSFSVNVTNLMYSPENDTWAQRKVPPIDLWPYVGAATTGEYAAKNIYVLGFESKHYVYNPISDSWTNCASIPKVRSGAGIAVLNDTICVIGGVDTFGIVAEFYQYIPPDYSIKTVTAEPTIKASQSSQSSQTTTKPTTQPTTKPTSTPEQTISPTPTEKPQSETITSKEINLPTKTIAIIAAVIGVCIVMAVVVVWKKQQKA